MLRAVSNPKRHQTGRLAKAVSPHPTIAESIQVGLQSMLLEKAQGDVADMAHRDDNARRLKSLQHA